MLSEFHVSTKPDNSYLATESTSGTRVATAIVNLPYSVQVLTEDFFKDFQLFDLDEQLPFVGGMAPGDKNQGGGGGTRLRGFGVPYFRNGFYRRQAPDSNSIARVEVVKGPQSAVYGRVSPGGVVNFISKKPATKSQSGLSYSLGSFDYSRVDGYLTGPLVANKLFYRVDAAYYDFERPTDFWFNRTLNLSGGLTYKVSADTSVTLEYEKTERFMNDYQNFTRWVDASGRTQGSVYDLPNRAAAQRLTEFNVAGADRRTDRLSDSTYLQIEHRFDRALSLRANLGYAPREFRRHWAGTAGNWDTRLNSGAGGWSGNRTMNEQTIEDLQYGAQIDLTKKWGGAVRQRSLLTFDISEDETKQKTWQLTGTGLDNELRALGLTTAADLTAWKKPDPFTPHISGRLPTPDFKPTLWPMIDGSTFNLYRYYYGGLFNHTVELLNERLMLTGSLRQDWAEFERQQPLSADPELRRASSKTDKLTSSVGANYHFVPRQLVGYISYGTSFDPAPQTDPNTGEILGNKTAAGVELGFKGALLQESFSYTLSVFETEQENEVTDNPANPSGADPLLARFVPGGSSKGRGLSLDLSGRLTENLTLLGNIAWTDIRISKNVANPALVGTRPTANLGMPGRTGALAARYHFKSGALSGLSLGLNYQYYQNYVRILGTATSSNFVLPTRSEWGAMANYSVRFSKKLSTVFSVNVTNLFDEQKLTPAAFSPPGREIRFTTSLKY